MDAIEIAVWTNVEEKLGLRRETVERYLAVCERLFLLRRLQPWHRNQATRLIKTPKLHFVDSGLCATLAGLETSDAVNRRDRFGAMLETFVVQQLVTQAGKDFRGGVLLYAGTTTLREGGAAR